MKKQLFLLTCTALLLTGCGMVEEGSSATEATTAETVTEAEAVEAEESALVMRIGTDPDGEIVLTGEDIESAEPFAVMEENDMQYSVVLTFKAEGRERFAEITSELAGTETPLAIWVDGELVSAPCVSAPIDDGKAVITGNFTVETAMELSRRIAPLSKDDIKEDEE